VPVPSKPLRDWVAAQQAPCYAIISAASDSAPVKAVTMNDGRTVTYPLYAGTPYAQWHPVMPYLVAISPRSGFLNWIEQTKATDWGWLFSSSAPQQPLIDHFVSLAQATMPNGERVFFRYWDGDYFNLIQNWLDEPTSSLIPPMHSCWVNGFEHNYTATEIPVRDFASWAIPQPLLDSLLKSDPRPMIQNLMQYIQENHGDLWTSFPYDTLNYKIAQFVADYSGEKDHLISALCDYLIEEKSF